MIEFCTSLEKTNMILKQLMLDPRSFDVDVCVECFDNCREQGYVLIDRLKPYSYMAISQNKNTDAIVIYKYDKIKFPSNLPDNQWDDKYYFDFHNMQEILDCVFNNLAKKEVLEVV